MGDVRTSTTVLGTDVDAPILIAPTAMHRFVCDDGELATARAGAQREHDLRRVDGRDHVARGRRGGRARRRALGADVHAARPGPNSRARRARRRCGLPRGRCQRRRRRGPAPQPARGRRARAARLVPLPEPRRPRRPRQHEPHGDGVGLRPDRHLRRPRVVRGVERAPRGGEGRDARRRRGAVRRRRRGRHRDLEPRRPHARRRRRHRRRAARDRRRRRPGGPRSTSTAASAAASTCCGRWRSARRR